MFTAEVDILRGVARSEDRELFVSSILLWRIDMSNFVSLTLMAKGPRIEEFRDHWDGMLKEIPADLEPGSMATHILDYREAYPEVPDYFEPYYDRHCPGSTISNGVLQIYACSSWRPPHVLISEMSARWPDLEFVQRSCIEYEECEAWYFQAGEASVIDLVTDMRTHEEWHVRNGVLLNWPKWFEFRPCGPITFHQLPRWAGRWGFPDTDDDADNLETACDMKASARRQRG